MHKTRVKSISVKSLHFVFQPSSLGAAYLRQIPRPAGRQSRRNRRLGRRTNQDVGVACIQHNQSGAPEKLSTGRSQLNLLWYDC